MSPKKREKNRETENRTKRTYLVPTRVKPDPERTYLDPTRAKPDKNADNQKQTLTIKNKSPGNETQKRLDLSL